MMRWALVVLVVSAGCGPDLDPPLAPLRSGVYSAASTRPEAVSLHCGGLVGEPMTSTEVVVVGDATLTVPAPRYPDVPIELDEVDDRLWELGDSPRWYCEDDYFVDEACGCPDGAFSRLAFSVQHVLAEQVTDDAFVLTQDYGWTVYLDCPGGKAEFGDSCDFSERLHYELLEACDHPTVDGCG